MQSVGAVILAAGGSSRLGKPKQLLPFQGQTLVRRAVEAANAGGCEPVLVVVGTEAVQLARELKAARATLVENENWRFGIGSSIQIGLQQLIDGAPSVSAVALLACDQPFVDGAHIGKLIAMRAEANKQIVASSYAGTLGVPAVFDRSCFGELLSLNGDTGAKPIIFANPQRVAVVPFPEGKIDIDTAEDWERFAAGW